MTRPIQFRSGLSARIVLVVTPDAWTEAAKRNHGGTPLRPLRIGERPYRAKDAAAAFGALVEATVHRVIAEGDELLVEIPIAEEEMPGALLEEWKRLKAVVDGVGSEKAGEVGNGKEATPVTTSDDPTLGRRTESR